MKVYDKQSIKTACGKLSEEIQTMNIPDEYKHLIIRYIGNDGKFRYAKFGEIVFYREKFIIITQDENYRRYHNEFYNRNYCGVKIRDSKEYIFMEATFAGVFTGRLDSNGQSIFTGDVVRTKDGIIAGVCAMSFFDKYTLLLDNHCLFLDDVDELTVLGNAFFEVIPADHEFDMRRHFNTMEAIPKDEYLKKITKAPYFKKDSWQEAVTRIFTSDTIPFVTCDRVSASRIYELRDNEVFVFGSNIEGNHIGGAARLAYDEFGAQWTKGVGHYGESYAIPTMDDSVDDIEPYVNDFLNYARDYPEYRFLVTEIGCGIAGYTVAEIAPLFYRALEIENICLPRSFWEELNVEAEQDREVIN